MLNANLIARALDVKTVDVSHIFSRYTIGLYEPLPSCTEPATKWPSGTFPDGELDSMKHWLWNTHNGDCGDGFHSLHTFPVTHTICEFRVDQGGNLWGRTDTGGWMCMVTSYGEELARCINEEVTEMKSLAKGHGAFLSEVKGTISVTLKWIQPPGSVKRNDLDLWVTPPSKEKIYHSHKQSQCGGTLGADKTQGDDNPVENVIWAHKAPIGHYKVEVNNYGTNHSDDVEFDIMVIKDGRAPQILKMTVPGAKGSTVTVMEFEYAG